MSDSVALAESLPVSKNWWLKIRNKRGEGEFERFDFIQIDLESGDFVKPVTTIMVQKIDGLVAESHSIVSKLIHDNITHIEIEKDKLQSELKAKDELLRECEKAIRHMHYCKYWLNKSHEDCDCNMHLIVEKLHERKK